MKVKVIVPSSRTLERYGITKREWSAQLRKQGGVCAICKKVPQTGRLVTDHYHAAGWKGMPAVQRRKYWRGILCGRCNFRFLPRGATPDILRAAADYLEAYEKRRPK